MRSSWDQRRVCPCHPAAPKSWGWGVEGRQERRWVKRERREEKQEEGRWGSSRLLELEASRQSGEGQGPLGVGRGRLGPSPGARTWRLLWELCSPLGLGISPTRPAPLRLRSRETRTPTPSARLGAATQWGHKGSWKAGGLGGRKPEPTGAAESCPLTPAAGAGQAHTGKPSLLAAGRSRGSLKRRGTGYPGSLPQLRLGECAQPCRAPWDSGSHIHPPARPFKAREGRLAGGRSKHPALFTE